MKKITFRFYLKKYAPYYVTSVVVLTISILLDLLQPLITEHIVDDVIIGGRIELLWKLLSGIIAMGIGRCIFQYIKISIYCCGTNATVLSYIIVVNHLLRTKFKLLY